MIKNNNQIRRYYLDLRNSLPSKFRLSKDKLIFENVKKYLKYNLFKKHIAIYYSINSEVSTLEIIKWLLDKKYHVYLPKITNDKDSLMEFVEINSIDDLEKNSFYNLYEPKIINESKYINPKKIDIIFIPLVVFDKNRNRVGMGKGYYDNYLKRTYAKRIGLAYQIQEHYLLQINNWDEKLDLIITENGRN